MKSFKEMAGITEAKIFNPKGKIGKKTISLPISAKDETEAEAKFIKRVELEQKNGNAPKGDITNIIVEGTGTFMVVAKEDKDGEIAKTFVKANSETAALKKAKLIIPTAVAAVELSPAGVKRMKYGYDEPIYESEDLNEAVDAMKVFEYYKSTFENVKWAAEHELDTKKKLDKMNRRILSDYAGNPGKLKEIYKQLQKLADNLSDNLDELDSIIG